MQESIKLQKIGRINIGLDNSDPKVITDSFSPLIECRIFICHRLKNFVALNPIPVAFLNEVIICIALIAVVVPAFCPSLFFQWCKIRRIISASAFTTCCLEVWWRFLDQSHPNILLVRRTNARNIGQLSMSFKSLGTSFCALNAILYKILGLNCPIFQIKSFCLNSCAWPASQLSFANTN